MDDATGTVRPDDPSRYTMRLDRDGTVTMRLDCNRGRGTWSARSGADGASGQFEFGPLAVTRARCPPPSMGEKIAAHAEFVRSYLLKDGRLYLSLMADGGIYEWEPDPDEPSAAGVPAPPETGGPRDWEVTATLNLREQPSAEALRPAASPDGRVAKGPDDSALRAGEGRFDATGTIRRAQWRGQPTARCEFGVARAGGSYATVVIKKPDGRTRAVCFRMGKPIGADTSEAESGEFSARREGDLNVIRVGSEGYEIPDAVALGG